MANVDRRVEIVTEHVRLENDHDFPACIGKFGRARYEVVAGDEPSTARRASSTS